MNLCSLFVTEDDVVAEQITNLHDKIQNKYHIKKSEFLSRYDDFYISPLLNSAIFEDPLKSDLQKYIQSGKPLPTKYMKFLINPSKETDEQKVLFAFLTTYYPKSFGSVDIVNQHVKKQRKKYSKAILIMKYTGIAIMRKHNGTEFALAKHKILKLLKF